MLAQGLASPEASFHDAQVCAAENFLTAVASGEKTDQIPALRAFRIATYFANKYPVEGYRVSPFGILEVVQGALLTAQENILLENPTSPVSLVAVSSAEQRYEAGHLRDEMSATVMSVTQTKIHPTAEHEEVSDAKLPYVVSYFSDETEPRRERRIERLVEAIRTQDFVILEIGRSSRAS